MNKVKAESYTLQNEDGRWLGQIVITEDGFFGAVTDWGNFSFAWRSYGNNFKDFILSLSVEYFASKMYTGMAYVITGKK